jgi:hypothetical protein
MDLISSKKPLTIVREALHLIHALVATGNEGNGHKVWILIRLFFFSSSSSLESTEWLYHKKHRLLLETMASFAKLPRLSRAMELPVRKEQTH